MHPVKSKSARPKRRPEGVQSMHTDGTKTLFARKKRKKTRTTKTYRLFTRRPKKKVVFPAEKNTNDRSLGGRKCKSNNNRNRRIKAACFPPSSLSEPSDPTHHAHISVLHEDGAALLIPPVHLCQKTTIFRQVLCGNSDAESVHDCRVQFMSSQWQQTKTNKPMGLGCV